MRRVQLVAVILTLTLATGFWLGRIIARSGGFSSSGSGQAITATRKGNHARTAEEAQSSAVESTRSRLQKSNSGVIPPIEIFPVPGVRASAVADSFNDKRGGGRIHEATDIMAPRGTPVLAVADGVIKKLFLSIPGGKTIYQFDPSETWCYYYAHLDRYADEIEDGVTVQRGELIAYVGSTGNASADAPHLHFAIFRLGPEKQYWKGTPIDPYPQLMQTLRLQP